MKQIGVFFGWVLCTVFFVLFIITLSLGRFLPAVTLFVCCLSALPLWHRFIKKKNLKIIAFFVRIILVFVMLFGFLILSFVHLAKKPLYQSEEVQKKLNQIYDSKLADWPLPYETRMIETACGNVFVIECGPKDAPPLLLFHAASMASWSWKYNIEALAAGRRVYAVDFIGEPGKGILTDETKLPMDAESLNEFYDEIAAKLGITGTYDIAAASFGGYIGLNQALHSPEKTGKIILLGPMGITPATSSVNNKLILYMLFPIKFAQDKMFYWALGDDPEVVRETEEWFWLVLNGVNRKGPSPLTFTAEQLQRVKSPVLLILGDKDQLVGSPEAVRPLAENVPDIQIEIMQSAHLMGIEKARQVNYLARKFLASNKIDIKNAEFFLYPEVNDLKPKAASPFLNIDGCEFIIAVTKENKYAVMPVTLENGRDIYKKIVVDTADFPALARTGLHSEKCLSSLKTITGRPLDKITELGRPNGLSQGGFMAEDEDILSVLKRDNEIVEKMGLTHKILARPLIHVLFMMDNDLAIDRWNMAAHRWENIKYFFYNDETVFVDAYDTKGGQKSIFDDGIEGGFHIKIWRDLSSQEEDFLKAEYKHLSAEQFEEMKTLLTFMNAGEMQPQYIMRYGFYEGHTFWRTGPIPIAFIFGLLTIEDLEKLFPGRLYEVLTKHHT